MSEYPDDYKNPFRKMFQDEIEKEKREKKEKELLFLTKQIKITYDNLVKKYQDESASTHSPSRQETTWSNG